MYYAYIYDWKAVLNGRALAFLCNTSIMYYMWECSAFCNASLPLVTSATKNHRRSVYPYVVLRKAMRHPQKKTIALVYIPI